MQDSKCSLSIRLRVRPNRERREWKGTVTAMKITAMAPTIMIMPPATSS